MKTQTLILLGAAGLVAFFALRAKGPGTITYTTIVNEDPQDAWERFSSGLGSGLGTAIGAIGGGVGGMLSNLGVAAGDNAG